MDSGKMLIIVAMLLGLVAIAISADTLLNPRTITIYKNVTVNPTTTILNIRSYNISSGLLSPPTSYSDSPVITQNQSFGQRLTNINAPLNASELGGINNAPDSYFETAGKMFMNNSLQNRVGVTPSKLPPFILNGKPVVIYLGSTTCIFCGENRWAMMLALSRFGNFSQLFKGYSALQDGDLPTPYWAPNPLYSSATVFGSYYSGKYISFLSIEDANPIKAGFNLNPLSVILQRANKTGNTAYFGAMQYIISTSQFSGTPFTIWGSYAVGGADAIIFGNTPPTSSTLELQSWTHEQVLSMLAHPNTQFAWSEYAAADFYVAMVCKSINNAAPVCSLPSIQKIEGIEGL